MEHFFYSIISAVPGVPSGDEIINLLFPNIWVFLAHIAASVILILLIVFLAWKPTQRYLDKKKTFLSKEVDEIETKSKETEINLENSKAKILEAKNIGNSIIFEANIESEKIKTNAQIESTQIFNSLKKEAEISIKKQEIEMSKKLNNQVIDLVFDATNSLLLEKINKDSNLKIVNKIIEDLKKDKEE
ncbi:MAG: hypothetical protein RSA40_02670 [Malacoplasma sp.]